MPWLGQVGAVLDDWYPGQVSGTSLARVLFGKADPSGHLPVTFPTGLSQVPASTPAQFPGVGGKVQYSEGLDVGYRWYDSQNLTPLFPFGFGLSYTTFDYSGLRVTPNAGGAEATFTITNTGKRQGGDVAQLYVTFPPALGEPLRQLKGYKKVSLEPWASQRMTIPLDARAFSTWSTAKGGWVKSAGCYGISVGDSSRSLPLGGDVVIGRGRCTPRTLRACGSRRAILVHLRGVRHVRVRSVAVYVNSKLAHTQRGARKTYRLRLGGRAKGTVRVRFVITTRGGRRLLDRRTYHPCVHRA
jgi:beta-glucosidase